MGTTTKEKNPRVLTAKKRAMIFDGFLLGWTVVLVVTMGGHPYSNWFYPFVGLILVAATAWIFRLDDSKITEVEYPPKSIEHALRVGAVYFVISLILFYGYVNLLRPELWLPAPAIFVSGMTAINAYRRKRGLKFAIWPSAILFVGFLALLEASRLVRG